MSSRSWRKYLPFSPISSCTSSNQQISFPSERQVFRRRNFLDPSLSFNVFTNLPPDVYHQLAAYLTRKDFLALLLTNKRYFMGIYCSVPLFSLGEKHSQRFLQQQSVRQYFHRRFSKQQLGLTICGYYFSSFEQLTDTVLQVLRESGERSDSRSLLLQRLHRLKLVRIDHHTVLHLLSALHQYCLEHETSSTYRLTSLIPQLWLKQIAATSSPASLPSSPSSSSSTSSSTPIRDLPLPTHLLGMFSEVVVEDMDGVDVSAVLNAVDKVTLLNCRSIHLSLNTSSIKPSLSLCLSSCTLHGDVIAFRHLHHLHLFNCFQLTTSTPLHNIYSLHIEFSQRQRHPFHLTQCEWSKLTIVTFTACSFLHSHPAFLLDCQRASFHHCSIHSNWTLFRHPQRVLLTFRDEEFRSLPTYTDNIKLWSTDNCRLSLSAEREVEAFFRKISAVTSVSILNGLTLTSLAGLGQANLQVTISACHYVSDFSCLCRVPYVHIVNCDGFTNTTDVRHVKTLIIESCDHINAVYDLPDIQSLAIIDCKSIRALDRALTVPVLRVKHCRNLVDMAAVRVSERIEIISCEKLTKSPPLSSVCSVYIEDCRNLPVL